MQKSLSLLFVGILFTTHTLFGLDLKVKESGANGDGKTIDTLPIQTAIDRVARAGGGRVLFTDGVFLSGTIFLKSNVTLPIEAGATLLGSPNISDYNELTWGHNVDGQPYHLIVADNAENVTIEGKGIIDGNGESFWQEYEKDAQGNMVVPLWIKGKKLKVSPLIEITRSRNISGINLRHVNLGWDSTLGREPLWRTALLPRNVKDLRLQWFTVYPAIRNNRIIRLEETPYVKTEGGIPEQWWHRI